MPTYEYECTKCGHVFEKFHSISAEPPKRCPECRCLVKRRLSGGAGLLFKGSGFYITDYRSEGYKKASKADQGGGGDKKSASSDKAGSAKSKAAAPSA
jgi:putative FmdB family regulatory protein